MKSQPQNPEFRNNPTQYQVTSLHGQLYLDKTDIKSDL